MKLAVYSYHLVKVLHVQYPNLHGMCIVAVGEFYSHHVLVGYVNCLKVHCLLAEYFEKHPRMGGIYL